MCNHRFTQICTNYSFRMVICERSASRRVTLARARNCENSRLKLKTNG